MKNEEMKKGYAKVGVAFLLSHSLSFILCLSFSHFFILSFFLMSQSLHVAHH